MVMSRVHKNETGQESEASWDMLNKVLSLEEISFFLKFLKNIIKCLSIDRGKTVTMPWIQFQNGE